MTDKDLRRIKRLMAKKPLALVKRFKLYDRLCQLLWNTATDEDRGRLAQHMLAISGATVAVASGQDVSSIVTFLPSDPMIALINKINAMAQAAGEPVDNVVVGLIAKLDSASAN